MSTTYAVRIARLEALPDRRHYRYRVLHAAGRPPRDGEPTAGKYSELPAARPARLPRVLVGVRVLLVDDDSDILELFTAALMACGAEVRAIDNAADALILAVQTRPDVVISDIAMGGQDGYWLVRELRLRTADLPKEVPIIAATAYGREHSRARALAAGFTEHLHKPVDPEVLCQTVARVAGG